ISGKYKSRVLPTLALVESSGTPYTLNSSRSPAPNLSDEELLSACVSADGVGAVAFDCAADLVESVTGSTGFCCAIASAPKRMKGRTRNRNEPHRPGKPNFADHIA